ncbi:uncharacterized protein LOC115956288 [Quercus lobata]|uniref:uncharacterized protein LOC115956288 n=1 Tax=Quercus lobata TaxID=97700 RepID=UPI001247C981|nr:uncharacterized protein LOC115956288 [Quercus lobata]
MDSRNYSSFTDLVRGNINLEDEIFDVSESSPLLVEDSPLNDEVATSKKKQARGVNFSAEEDKLLVAAWLNTSVILSKIEAKNESGTTAHDKIEKAKELFKEIHGSVFQFEHCWLILKDYPKWASTMPRGDSRKEMPQTPDLIDQGVGVDGIMDFERPIGRKAEKANRKRKDDGKDIATEYLKKKMKVLEEGCVAEKERVRIKAEKVRLQELKENERIMMLDTSGMNEDQKAFYDGLKKEILAKQRSSHSLG